MSQIFTYTFRTNKHAKKFKDIFIFGKLKEDFKSFTELIQKKNPKLIIGLAEAKTKTRIESVAVNRFGKAGIINKAGKKSYKLHVPKDLPFTISKKPTTSFCNWTMYKISQLGAPVSFIHYNTADLPVILDMLK